MIKLKLLAAILLSLLVLSAEVTASDLGEILWYRAYFPPVTIPDGQNRDRGFFDRAMNYVIDRLPEYTHNFRTANFKRIVAEIRKGNNVCCPSLYKTEEREQYIAFSLPAMVVLPNGVVTMRSRSDKFSQYLDDTGKISLADLLANKDLTLGISNGRVYSGGIDEVLAQYENSANILVRSGDDVFRGLMSMMQLGRVDYILGYPTEAMYFSDSAGKSRNYMYFPVRESGVSFTLGHFGCSKTTYGNEIIRKIDDILLSHRAGDFLEFYEYWLDDSTKINYRSLALEFYNSQK